MNCDLINSKKLTVTGNVCCNCILSAVTKTLCSYRYLFLSVIVSRNSQTIRCWSYIRMNCFLCGGVKNLQLYTLVLVRRMEVVLVRGTQWQAPHVQENLRH